MRGYRAIGYASGEAPLGHRELPEVTIEYDPEIDDEESAMIALCEILPRTWRMKRTLAGPDEMARDRSPAVTHAHYIDHTTARRARTRRVIGKMAPDPTLRVVGDKPSSAAMARRKRTGRASVKADAGPTLHAVVSGAPEVTEPAAAGETGR